MQTKSLYFHLSTAKHANISCPYVLLKKTGQSVFVCVIKYELCSCFLEFKGDSKLHFCWMPGSPNTCLDPV